MASEPTIPTPPGDPDTLTTVVGNLRKIAGDMDKHGGAITNEVGPMRQAWKSAGGSSAADEASTLGGIVKDYGGHINTGASALSTYAGKLSTFKSNVSKWQGTLHTDDQSALATARKKNAGLTDAQLRDTDDYKNSPEAEDIHRIIGAYNTAKGDLTKAGTTCEEALGNAIPGYKKGMTPAQMMATTLNNVLLKLPSAAADQARQDAQVFQYQLAHGLNPKDPFSLAMYQRIAAEANNPAYADAFANYLKADGLVTVPEAIVQAERYGGMTPGQGQDLITAMSNIIGTATNTTNNPNHLADAEIKKLVGYASNTDTVDAGREGGNWQRSWAMSELLGYSNNWSPKFLSDVSGEIYDNRGKLRHQTQLSDETAISAADNGFIHTDPMITALQKLDKNSAAGRLFFDVKGADGQPDRILDLMREYSQAAPTAIGNSESILTDAIKQAAIDFPPGGRTGADGQRGADIASWFLHDASLEAQGQAGFVDTLYSPTQHAVASILSSYYGDVNRTLRDGSGIDLGQGAYKVSTDPLFNGQYGANISNGDLSLLLSNVMHDDGMRNQIYQAAATYTSADLQLTAANHGNMDRAYVEYGANLKRLLSAANRVDAQNAQDSKELLGMVKVASGVLGVYMPGESEVGAITANALKTLKAVGDGSLANFVDPVGSQAKDYADRLQAATNGADNLIISSGLHYQIDNQPQLDPSKNPSLSWTDGQGHKHLFYDPKTNEIDPPPTKRPDGNTTDYDKFAKWYDDILSSGDMQNYRQDFDNGFDHPPQAGG